MSFRPINLGADFVTDRRTATYLLDGMPEERFNAMMAVVMKSPSPTLLMRSMSAGRIPKGFGKYFPELVPIPPIVEMTTAVAETPAARTTYALGAAEAEEFAQHWVLDIGKDEDEAMVRLMRKPGGDFQHQAVCLRGSAVSDTGVVGRSEYFRPNGVGAHQAPGGYGLAVDPGYRVIPHILMTLNGAVRYVAFANSTTAFYSGERQPAVRTAFELVRNGTVLAPDGVGLLNVNAAFSTFTFNDRKYAFHDRDRVIASGADVDIDDVIEHSLLNWSSNIDRSLAEWVAALRGTSERRAAEEVPASEDDPAPPDD